MNKSILRKLSKVKLFDKASEDELSAMLDGCRVTEYKSGEQICSPESFGSRMCVILSGTAEVFSTENSEGTLMRRLYEGDLFGVSNLFSKESFVSRICAKGKCRVLFIPEESFGALIEKNRAVLYEYIGFLSDRIRFLNKKVSYLTAGSAERRLAVYLSSFDSDRVNTGLSFSALSDMLNVGRASLYRAFEILENDGFILREDKNFIILDRKGMLEKYKD